VATAVDSQPAPRILLVEDDAEMRRLVARALAKDGFEVVCFADGRSVVTAIDEELAHDGEVRAVLLVTDVRVPGLGGLEVASWVRSRGITIPIIVMTGFGDDEVRKRARALDAVSFDKPFPFDELRRVAVQLANAANSPQDAEVPQAKHIVGA
jgi:DNA-binding response OmpR family regulator